MILDLNCYLPPLLGWRTYSSLKDYLCQFAIKLHFWQHVCSLSSQNGTVASITSCGRDAPLLAPLKENISISIMLNDPCIKICHLFTVNTWFFCRLHFYIFLAFNFLFLILSTWCRTLQAPSHFLTLIDWWPSDLIDLVSGKSSVTPDRMSEHPSLVVPGAGWLGKRVSDRKELRQMRPLLQSTLAPSFYQ